MTLNKNTEQLIGLMFGLIVGALCGLAVFLYLLLLQFVTELSFGSNKTVLGFLEDFYVILLPAIGGMFVGPLIHFIAKEARGHGVPEVMADVILKGGVIPPRVVLIKSLASIATIGFGGSAGRVGPIIHISAGIGSIVGQFLKIHPNIMRSLVACGVAGGIAATFNAPIGGAMFAMEVILADFATSHLMMIIVSSVTASVIGRALFSNAMAITVPQFVLHSPAELILYGALGTIIGLFSVLFVKIFYKVEDLFSACTIVPNYVKPVIGGLIVGIIGFYLPEVFGVGYNVIEMTLIGQMTIVALILLLIFKLLATSITLGSGGSGGVFAPILYLGAMLGGAFGIFAEQMFPKIVIEPMAYALAGMAGMLAASSFAPITAIILLFEMSNDYRLILPIMITAVISFSIASALTRYNIYTTKLFRNGLDINNLRRPDVLKNICVKDIMTTDTVSIFLDYTATQALMEVENTPHHAFPVVSDVGEVMGIITRKELRRAVKFKHSNTTVAMLIKKELIFVIENDCLNHAVELMFQNSVGRLPVLNEQNMLVGIISRSDIINAYGGVEKKNLLSGSR